MFLLKKDGNESKCHLFQSHPRGRSEDAEKENIESATSKLKVLLVYSSDPELFSQRI
jgi:hypothetical protein